MASELVQIKTAQLHNHCPECYSTEGLELSFSQRFKENSFYKTLTNQITTDLYCTKCESQIFPVNWTEDIERVVDYHSKAFQPREKTFKLKPLAWIILIAIDLIILLVILIAFNVIEI